MTTTVLIAALAKPTFDLAVAADHVADAHQLIERIGVGRRELGALVTTVEELDELFEGVDLSGVAAVMVLQATFSDASMVIRLAELTELPLIVWSFPEPRTGGRLRLNSLCGANLAAYSLRRRACNAHFVHVAPTADEAPLRVLAALQDLDSADSAGSSLAAQPARGARRSATRRARRRRAARIDTRRCDRRCTGWVRTLSVRR